MASRDEVAAKGNATSRLRTEGYQRYEDEGIRDCATLLEDLIDWMKLMATEGIFLNPGDDDTDYLPAAARLIPEVASRLMEDDRADACHDLMLNICFVDDFQVLDFEPRIYKKYMVTGDDGELYWTYNGRSQRTEGDDIPTMWLDGGSTHRIYESDQLSGPREDTQEELDAQGDAHYDALQNSILPQ